MGDLKVKVNGSWKDIFAGYVKVDGSWKDVEKIFVKVDGGWKESYIRGLNATGGNVEDKIIGGQTYRIHTFSSSGTFTVISGGDAEILMVGTGGKWSGRVGTTYGAGGGGGEVLEFTERLNSNTNYSITVQNQKNPYRTSSTRDTYATKAFNRSARAGLSGGYYAPDYDRGGTSGNGNQGGLRDYIRGGAGGGAGGPGTGALKNNGPGVESSITGTSVEYGAGGFGTETENAPSGWPTAYGSGESRSRYSLNGVVIIRYPI